MGDLFGIMRLAGTALLTVAVPSPPVSPDSVASGVQIAINEWSAVIILCITLFFTIILTVRKSLASLGVGQKWKHADWIYGKYDRAVLLRVFKDLGYKSEYEQKNFEKALRNKKPVYVPGDLHFHRRSLIKLISKIMTNHEEIRYGGSPATCYYINTMGASHQGEHLKVMTKAVAFMIESICKKNPPDFILTPKIGNPLLGMDVADEFNIKCVLCKFDSDASMPKGKHIDPRNRLDIKFEGLMDIVKDKEKRLSGIIVDCNVSGGKQIRDAAEKFNELVRKADLNIERISHAFVLFKVDNDERHAEMDNKFARENDLTLHRYFDLDDEVKKDIYALHDRAEQLRVDSDNPEEELNRFLSDNKRIINFKLD